MPTYRVFMVNTVSACIEVEADSPETAIDAAYDSENMPGSITIGAFGVSSVDDGEWEPESVTDASGAEVWRDGE